MLLADRIRATIRRSPFRGLARATRNSLRFGGIALGGGIRFLSVGTVYVSSDDARGRALLDRQGVFQPANLYLWRRLVARLNPGIVLDIGANYGDLLLSTRYPAGARIMAFEPNPAILPYLRRSAATHVNAATIIVQDCLVTDRDGDIRRFTVDHRWSGTSSAIGAIDGLPDELTGGAPPDVSEMEVRSRSIDGLLDGGRAAAGRRLLFKIDVEGFEGHVVRGMTRTLAAADRHAGLIEYDADRLERAGTDPGALIRLLRRRGALVRMAPDGTLVPIREGADVPSACELVAASDPGLLAALRVPLMCR